MGRYPEKYWDNRTTPLEDAVGTMFTMGITNLIPEPDLAFKCEITDTETGEVGVSEEWMPTRDMAHDAAWNDLQENNRQYYENLEYERNIRLKESASKPDTEDNDSSSSGWLIKIIFYLALIVGAIWLAFAVVLPLLIINIAIICLICSLIYRQQKLLFSIVSFLGAIFILLDYNNRWLTKTLAENVHFFEKTIPFFFYLNFSAGLIACYFLIRDLFDEHKPTVSISEFSKRNLMIMGSLLVVGTAAIFLQNHFESGRSFGAVTNINNSSNLGDTNTPTQNVSADNSINNNTLTNYPGIYPQSSGRLLISNDLLNLNKNQLRIMRNEIFARHGYIFKTAAMKGYFATQSWYRPLYNNVDNQLSPIEKANVELIKSYEK